MSEPLLHVPEGVYARSVSSGWWYGAGMIAQKALSLIGLLVLVRLLQPEDYGTIAALVVVAGLFDQLTSIPFGHAMIQRKEGVERFMDPLWTWDLCRAALLALLIAVFAQPIAAYFEIEGMGRQLVPWAGVLLLLPALSNPRQLYFFRLLDMRRVFWRDSVASAAAVVASLTYALGIEASVMALFVGQLARLLASAVMSYILYPAWPRISFAFRRLRELFGFGKWIYGQNLLNYITATADRVVVGGIMEVERLGLYTRARDLSLTASSIVASGFDKIGMPAFARLQDQSAKIKAGVQKSLDLFVMTSVPFALVILCEGGTAVPLILGEQWIAIVLPLKIFAVGSFAYAVVSIVQPLLVGTGHPQRAFFLRVFQASIALPLLALGGWWYGPIGLAVAMSVSWYLAFAFGLWQARPVLRLGVKDVWRTLLPSCVAGLALFVVDVVGRGAIHTLSIWWVHLLWYAFLAAVYFGALLLASARMGEGPFETFRQIAAQLVSRLRAKWA